MVLFWYWRSLALYCLTTSSYFTALCWGSLKSFVDWFTNTQGPPTSFVDLFDFLTLFVNLAWPSRPPYGPVYLQKVMISFMTLITFYSGNWNTRLCFLPQQAEHSENYPEQVKLSRPPWLFHILTPGWKLPGRNNFLHFHCWGSLICIRNFYQKDWTCIYIEEE